MIYAKFKIDELVVDLPVPERQLTEMQPIGNVPETPTLLAWRMVSLTANG